MAGSSDVTFLFLPLAGSGCLPSSLRCSDWDVARQPHHPRCCSASGTQVGAYVDLTPKEQQCWGVEGGLPGKILDGAEAQGVKPNLNHHHTQRETPLETVHWSCTHSWLSSSSALSQQHSRYNPDGVFFFQPNIMQNWTLTDCPVTVGRRGAKHKHKNDKVNQSWAQQKEPVNLVKWAIAT